MIHKRLLESKSPTIPQQLIMRAKKVKAETANEDINEMYVETHEEEFEDTDPIIETIPMFLNPSNNENIQLWQFTNKNKKHVASPSNNIDNNLYNVRYKKATGSWEVDFNLANANANLPFYNIPRLASKYNEEETNSSFKQQIYEEPGNTDPQNMTFFQNMTGVEIDNQSSFTQLVGVLTDKEDGSKALELVKMTKNVQFRPSFKYIDEVKTKSSAPIANTQQTQQQGATMVTLSAANKNDQNGNAAKLTGSLLAYKLNDEEPSIQYLYDREKPYIKDYINRDQTIKGNSGKPMSHRSYMDSLLYK
ncbi:DNA-directed RNA polymerase III subunit HuRPC5 [Hanseniaspora uvarum DSM 2768]|uniref:DNA-directed RNA polymerase III subunit RPC5 n=1 Tax=Hanseniaspora uvarum TaxID=29833 RepID=A0A1E5RJA6_HANUV|nr:DNA-directed RNA polymerase III subunit HuRPC5 [Hanseniaspora uvarum DSM 2768]OEJ87000.1 hypothetical protein AWRI3580_g2739 [Hanseniaspora uvarum]